MPEGTSDKFVIKTDVYEKCLIIYTIDEWERQIKIIRAKTNSFNPKHAAFLREYYRGTAELKLDSNNRVLIPSRLLEYAEINKDVFMLARDSRIELWANENKTEQLSPEELAKLAKEVMGGELLDL